MCAFAVDFAGCDDDERCEGNDDEDGGVDAVELAHLSIEEGKADKDKEYVGAEDLERGFAQGDEWLDHDETLDGFTEPVDDAGEGDEVQHADGADLPFVDLQAKSWVGCRAAADSR